MSLTGGGIRKAASLFEQLMASNTDVCPSHLGIYQRTVHFQASTSGLRAEPGNARDGDPDRAMNKGRIPPYWEMNRLDGSLPVR